MTPLTGGEFYPIDNLDISKKGAIEQFPDLKDNKNWREEAIKRLKYYIGSMKSEKEVAEYIKAELTKPGYSLLKEDMIKT